MDQPYSRIADALLDYQYWSPNDPQKNPYDDTGWTFGELFNVQVVRVTDVKVLDAPMEKVSGEVRAPGRRRRHRGRSRPSTTTPTSRWSTLRYRLKDASFEAAEEPFEAGGRKFNRGIVHRQERRRRGRAEAAARSRPPDRTPLATAPVGEDPSDSRAARRDPPHAG